MESGEIVACFKNKENFQQRRQCWSFNKLKMHGLRYPKFALRALEKSRNMILEFNVVLWLFISLSFFYFSPLRFIKRSRRWVRQQWTGVSSSQNAILTSHERQGVSNLGQISCLLNSLFVLIIKETWRFRITGAPWIPITKGSWYRKRFHVITLSRVLVGRERLWISRLVTWRGNYHIPIFSDEKCNDLGGILRLWWHHSVGVMKATYIKPFDATNDAQIII